MSILDKLKFWKKEDEFELPPETPPVEQPTFPQLEEMPKDIPSFAKNFTQEPQFTPPSLQPPSFQAPPFQQPDKNFEILNAKIDAIRATLDAINQKLERIDKPEVRWR